MYKNYYEKFEKRDLIYGQKYENWIGQTFLEEYETNEDNQYDLKTNKHTYEIKVDSQCFIYYRFGFEVSSWGNKLSGIWTTQSDFWVCIVPVLNKVIMMNIDDIKDFIKKHHHTSVKRSSGDNNASKMILWDWNYYMKHMIEKEVIDIKVPFLYGDGAKTHLFNKMLNYIKRDECEIRREEDDEINKHYLMLEKKIRKF